MTLSLSIDTATSVCTTASWCEHHEAAGGMVVHFSSFDLGSGGIATALRLYSFSDGEPFGDATLIMIAGLPGREPLDEAKVDYARELLIWAAKS